MAPEEDGEGLDPERTWSVAVEEGVGLEGLRSRGMTACYETLIFALPHDINRRPSKEQRAKHRHSSYLCSTR